MSTDAPPEVLIHEVSHNEWLEAARSLFQEYAHSLSIDLTFQRFDDELINLPGDYAAPLGGLFVATLDGLPAGCCAFRPLIDVDYENACEMKRLYVPKSLRGFGLGRLLVEHTLLMARNAGYSTMLLDTLDDMEAARALYQEAGFVEIPPYYYNPIPGARYLKVDLQEPLRT